MELRGTEVPRRKNMGGSEADEGRCISVDNSGNAHITGVFRLNVDFDPNSSVYNLTSSGEEDIFIQKLDPNGNLTWVRQIGGNSSDQCISITHDNFGNVITAGHFKNEVDFDPGANELTYTSNGDYDIFINKLDINGELVWAKNIGGSLSDLAYSIDSDADGNGVGAGYYDNDGDDE